MYQARAMMFLYAQTWLHPGAGTSTGAIDLPVQREVHTRFPVIPASSVKGSLRDQAEKVLEQDDVDGLFGPDIAGRGQSAGATYAGALVVGDGKILLFPVRSLTNSFYWVTSPLALARFSRDMNNIMGSEPDWDLPASVDEGMALVPGEAPEKLYLEDMDFTTCQHPGVAAVTAFLADQMPVEGVGKVYRDKLRTDVAVIADDEFKYFVEFATQVSARVQLTSKKTTDAIKDDDGKVIERGNLWYEETIPPETVFYVSCMADSVRGGSAKERLNTGSAVLDLLENEVLGLGAIQLGANTTLGHGWCAASLRRGQGR